MLSHRALSKHKAIFSMVLGVMVVFFSMDLLVASQLALGLECWNKFDQHLNHVPGCHSMEELLMKGQFRGMWAGLREP